MMHAHQAEDLLDLAFAEIGRGANLADRRDQRLGDGEIDCACKPDRLFKPRVGIARDMMRRLRIGIAPPRTQVRADDNHPPGCFAACRLWTVGGLVNTPGFQSDRSQAGASSPPSNNWIGAPGMMVEIACL